MTVILGFAMIVVFMTLIMTKKLSPILALIPVSYTHLTLPTKA